MTIPAIPDNIYKFFLLAGSILFAYGIYLEDIKYAEYNNTVDNYISGLDSLELKLLISEHEGKRLLAASDIVAKRYGVENPIKRDSSMYIFEQTISGDSMYVKASDSIAKLWLAFQHNNFLVKLYEKKVVQQQQRLKSSERDLDNATYQTNAFLILAFIFLISGAVALLRFQGVQDALLTRQLKEKPNLYDHCQSCGKNFSAVRTYGSNADKSKSYAFCSSCFQEGKFTRPDLTWSEFIASAQPAIDKRKNKIGKWLLRTRLQNLERWRPDEFF